MVFPSFNYSFSGVIPLDIIYIIFLTNNKKRIMKTYICSQCKKECKSDGVGTGYGRNKNNKKVCYSCCGDNDKRDLLNSKIGDKFIFYFSGGVVTNWPSSLVIKPNYVKKGGHNWWNCERHDFWFVLEGKQFWGYQIGPNTEIAHIKRIKD